MALLRESEEGRDVVLVLVNNDTERAQSIALEDPFVGRFHEPPRFPDVSRGSRDPLTPALSPSGGEGARRAREGVPSALPTSRGMRWVGTARDRRQGSWHRSLAPCSYCSCIAGSVRPDRTPPNADPPRRLRTGRGWVGVPLPGPHVLNSRPGHPTNRRFSEVSLARLLGDHGQFFAYDASVDPYESFPVIAEDTTRRGWARRSITPSARWLSTRAHR